VECFQPGVFRLSFSLGYKKMEKMMMMTGFFNAFKPAGDDQKY